MSTHVDDRRIAVAGVGHIGNIQEPEFRIVTTGEEPNVSTPPPVSVATLFAVLLRIRHPEMTTGKLLAPPMAPPLAPGPPSDRLASKVQSLMVRVMVENQEAGPRRRTAWIVGVAGRDREPVELGAVDAECAEYMEAVLVVVRKAGAVVREQVAGQNGFKCLDVSVVRIGCADSRVSALKR